MTVLNEFKYILNVVINKKHPKLIFREMVAHWYYLSSQWVVPKEIYKAIDNYDTKTAQELLDKQKQFWDEDDREIVRAQSYIDLI